MTTAERTHAIDPAQMPRRATAVRWRIVLLLVAYTFMFHLNRNSIQVAGAERIMPDYRIDEKAMGLVYSAFFLVYTLCMLPGGWLTNRFGAKFALVVMGLGTGLCVVLTGAIGFLVAPAMMFASLLLVRGLMGVPGAPMHPAAARAVAAWMPRERRTLANGLVTAGALLGAAGPYYLFGSLMGHVGWPMAFAIAGMATMALALVWTLYATASPAGHRGVNEAELRLVTGAVVPVEMAAGEPVPWHALLANRSLILLTLSYAVVGYFQYLFFNWLVYYFKQVVELDSDATRLYTTIPLLAMAGGMFAGGWLTDRACDTFGARWGRALVAVVSLLGGAAFLGLGLAAAEPRSIVTCFACMMASVGLCEGAFWVTAIELGGTSAGSSAAILNTGGNAGGIISPALTPFLSEMLGWNGALSIAAALCVIAAGLWLGIDPQERVAGAPGD
ncbi:MAG: MFS transporter [Planctomycetia bacterium]|nr:MFS transporter [Planctomycetia bacterium]